jgi:trimeric autotransporter adhesin
MKYTFTSLLSLSLLLANAQQQTPSSDLQQLESHFNQRFQTEKLQAETLATTNQIPLRYQTLNGTVVEFSGFDQMGQMLFNKTDNIGAGRTISTNKVWPGGTVGTALTGANMTNRLGEWDGGAVRKTHQEFGGRVTQVDGATTVIDHATHVAGTMIASGVSPNAIGMSYAATLKAYDWNNDESEMAAAAGAGMLLSNHSYGTIAGWYFNDNLNRWEWYGDPSISATEDWKFGFYDQQAADWDNIAFNAPYYLICKSAGNDRGDDVQGSNHFVRNSNGVWVASTATRNVDGNTLGYDCIPTNGTSKNILTVGAVNKIGNSNSNNGYVNAAGVVMSSFSGWGPTDDGRIKPDVVAAGVNLYSSFSGADDDYASISGTSMSSPTVTGSLLLVQQHYNNLNGKFMRSASLKALMIHTADEAGSAAGPDYKFGWGLLNTAKAVQLITDSNYNQIQERVLANGTTYNQGFAVDGNTPLRATICWTEKPGTPVASSLNPTTRMLLNDLDIRITRNSDNTVFLPWILNPANPQAAATQGDNTRDNVEQILIPTPAPGTYTITVSHKGTLVSSASQNYSLVISGIIGKPAAAFSNTPSTICSAKTVTFTDNSGGNPTSKTWYFPGGTPNTSTASSVVVTYNTPGNFPVALKITNSIGADSVYFKDYVKVGGLKLPFLETFENNSPSLKDWSVSNGVNNTDSDTTKWRLATISGNPPGNTAYCMPSFYYTSSNKKDLLLSPPLNFYGFQNVALKFNHAYATKNGRHDSLRIYISTNCGTTWTPITSNDSITGTSPQQNLTSFVPASSGDWCLNCYTINLGAYDGQSNLRLRFETTSSFGNNTYLDNISVSGDALPPSALYGTSNTTVCAGNPVYFADSSTNNPTKWKWTFTGAANVTDTTQNPSVTWNTPGTYDVKLAVFNSGGSDSLIKTAYITVLPSPNKPNIINAANGMCNGDSVLLSTDSAANGFVWYRDHIAIPLATGAQYYALLAGDYRVTLLGSNGCSTTSTDVKIESGPKPDVPSITSNITGTSFCDGGTATLTSSAATGNQWFKDNNPINGEVNKTLATKVGGSYTVITTISGCPSDPSNTLSYTLKPKPVTSSITGNTNAKFNTDEVYSVTSTSGSTYTWTITNGTPSNASSSVSVKWGTSPSGNVAVKETGSNGCIGDVQNLAITLTPNTAINGVSFTSGLSIYPNPMNDLLSLTFAKGSAEKTSIRMINMIGQTVLEESINEVSLGYVFQLNVSKLNSGVYFVEISNAEGSKQLKVVKK